MQTSEQMRHTLDFMLQTRFTPCNKMYNLPHGARITLSDNDSSVCIGLIMKTNPFDLIVTEEHENWTGFKLLCGNRVVHGKQLRAKGWVNLQFDIGDEELGFALLEAIMAKF